MLKIIMILLGIHKDNEMGKRISPIETVSYINPLEIEFFFKFNIRFVINITKNHDTNKQLVGLYLYYKKRMILHMIQEIPFNDYKWKLLKND